MGKTRNTGVTENTGTTEPEVPEVMNTGDAPTEPTAPTNQGEETKAPGPEAPTETAKAVAAVRFTPVQFRSPIKSMVYRMPDGNHIVFSDGRFTANTEAEYHFLKNHIDFNRSLFEEK